MGVLTTHGYETPNLGVKPGLPLTHAQPYPQPPPINHLLPKVRHVECDGGTHTDATVGCVGRNGQVYLTQWWGHVGCDGWACGKMQWSGVWDTTIGCI